MSMEQDQMALCEKERPRQSFVLQHGVKLVNSVEAGAQSAPDGLRRRWTARHIGLHRNAHTHV